MHYESPSGNLLRISQRKNETEYQSVSIIATIEIVKIGNHKGEYVVGGWKAIPPKSEDPSIGQEITLQAEWVLDGNIHFLRWQENDILYEILYVGIDPNSVDYLNKDELITIAENLQ